MGRHICTFFYFLVEVRGSDRGTSVVFRGSFHGLPWKSAGFHGKGHGFHCAMGASTASATVVAMARFVFMVTCNEWHVPRFCPWQPPWYQPWQPTEVPRQLPRHVPSRPPRQLPQQSTAINGIPWQLPRHSTAIAAAIHRNCHGNSHVNYN